MQSNLNKDSRKPMVVICADTRLNSSAISRFLPALKGERGWNPVSRSSPSLLRMLIVACR